MCGPHCSPGDQCIRPRGDLRGLCGRLVDQRGTPTTSIQRRADPCENDFDCLDLLICLSNCNPGDQACADACGMQYQAGIPLYNALADCVFCQACYFDCNGASIGCP